jgi:hypothetical protein
MLSVWAMLVCVTLLFTQKATCAQTEWQEHSLRAFALGVLLTATAGLAGMVLLQQANGLFKLIGWVLLLALFGLSTVGSSGLALLVAERVQGVEPQMSRFGALIRAAGFLIAMGLVPLLGWFLITPITIIMSLGAGCRTLRRTPHKIESRAVELRAAEIASGRIPSEMPSVQVELPVAAGIHPVSTIPVSTINAEATR